MSEAPWKGLAGPVGDEGPEDEYVLAVEGLYKRFGENPDLYHDMHLRIRRGEIVVIVGESGIGKSVFLKHLIGLEDPTKGGIWYRRGGRFARDWPIHLMAESDMKDVRREISMVFQASSLFDWMTVQENIALPLEEHRPLVQARLHSFLDDPTELLVLLRRAPQAPELFAGLSHQLKSTRETLQAQAKELAAAVKKGDAALERAIVSAFGFDAAQDVAAARFKPDEGSAWASAESVLNGWSAETLGDLLVAVEDELAPSVRTFRAAYVDARRGLRTAWSTVRRSWQDDFSDLVVLLAASWLVAKGQAPSGKDARALLGQVNAGDLDESLAKVIEDWASDAGSPLDAAKASGTERLRQALALLKVRPTLLSGPLERAKERAPGVFAPLATALTTFTHARAGLEAQLLRATQGSAEADLRRALMLSWLVVRPMAVDLAAQGTTAEAGSAALVAAVLDGFVDRPEELGLLLSRRPAPQAPPQLARFTQGFDTFRSAFSKAFRELLERNGDELTDQFTELVVSGLMASVKLDVARDREKLPSELSGGMRTRVGLARSLATLPSVVLYDEPTAGLDPVLSKNIAAGILELQTSGVVSTSIVVTHDKDLYRTLKLAGRTRMLYLSSGRFLDIEGRPVRDPLRLGESSEPAAPITEPGVRGYPPAVFIEEFEPRESDPRSAG